MDIKPKPKPSLTRRLFIALGSLILLFPLARFITHRVPRKPVIINIREPLNTRGFLVKESFIIFSENDRLWAVSRQCTHLGCRINYKEEEQYLECPCHQSRFTTQGDVLRGPAQKQLPVYKVEQSEDKTTLTVVM